MPRIGGINVIGVVLATIAFYMIGFVFYGVLFTEDWTAHTLASTGVADFDSIRQMSPERLEAAWEKAFPNSDPAMSMGLGFLSTLVTVIVLAVVLRQLTAGAASLVSYAGFAALLAVGFSITSLLYDHIYAEKTLALFWIDGAHVLIGYVVSAIVLSFFE